MKELTLLYTNIQHEIRRDLDISCLEYVLVDMIYHLSTKPDSAVIGWCYKSKEQLALEIGLTKQGLLKMVDRLILCGLLEKNVDTRYLKTTEKYFSKLFTNGKQSLPQGSKQSLPLGVNKVDPIIITNNNTNYNSSLPEEKKDEGFDLSGKERAEFKEQIERDSLNPKLNKKETLDILKTDLDLINQVLREFKKSNIKTDSFCLTNNDIYKCTENFKSWYEGMIEDCILKAGNDNKFPRKLGDTKMHVINFLRYQDFAKLKVQLTPKETVTQTSYERQYD